MQTAAARTHCVVDSPVGELLLRATGDRLAGCYFEGHTYPPATELLGTRVTAGEVPVLAQAAAELDEYFAGRRRRFDLPLFWEADEFSRSVWEILLAIAYGATTTYGQIAAELGNPGLAQRVGQAVGHNPISIVVPCHRVLGADGSLTGFAGGLDRKRFLLNLEEPPAEADGRLF